VERRRDLERCRNLERRGHLERSRHLERRLDLERRLHLERSVHLERGLDLELAMKTPRTTMLYIALCGVSALAVAAGLLQAGWSDVDRKPVAFAFLLAITVVLQLAAVEMGDKAAVSFASAGLLALGFVFGPLAAMTGGAVTAAVRLAASRGKLHKGVFDAADLALAAAAGSGFYRLVGATGWSTSGRFAAAVVGSIVFFVVNTGLLSIAMSTVEKRSPLALWTERFRWMAPYTLVAGLIALGFVVAYDHLGSAGPLTIVLAPLAMALTLRQRTPWQRATA
jgi:hypothetical protein